MKLMKLIPTLTAAALLAACATTPDTHPELTRLENRLEADLRDAEIVRVARPELDEADDRLDLARVELDDDGVSGDFMHQLYLADRWLDLAETRTRLALADRRAAQLADERDEIVLKARLTRAEVARLEAEAEAALARDRAAVAETARDIATADALDQRVRARQAEQQVLNESLRARQAEAEALAAAERAGDAYLTAEQARERARAAELARAEAQQEAAQARAELSELQSMVAAELDARQTERGLVLTLDDVLFEFDSAVLTSGGERHLDKLAAYLRAHPERHIRVEGFTDSVGSENYNAMLSERRAIAVAERLIVNGVSPERVTAEGYGEDYPVATNNTEAGRQQNRRVEVVIALDDAAEVEDRVVFVPAD